MQFGTRGAGRRVGHCAAGAERGWVPILRILIAYDERHLAYAHAFEQTIRAAKPGADTRIASLRDLDATVASFAPHLVVSGEAEGPDSGAGAWFMLSPEPERVSEFRLGERRWRCTNPDLAAVMRIVESVDGLLRDGREPRDV